MASLQHAFGGSFNAAAVEPQEARDSTPLPAGQYTVEITNSEVKDLASGNGIGLSLEFTVIDPEQFARRKVWANLNIKHTSEEAERIGQSQLSALCRAVGIGLLKDSDELFQKIVKIRTKIRPGTNGYGPKAEVTSYEPSGTSAPPPVAQQAQRPAAAAPKAAPWARKAA